MAIVAFWAWSPKEAITRATEVATAVALVIESRKLFSMIQGKKYVRCEGWTTMGALLGVFPQIEWSRPVERDGVYGYEARAIVKTLAGATVSAGDAECWSDERNWSGRDRFALRSMAETRATGKAMRVALSWVMALAGYEVTPAEEMPAEPFPTRNPARRATITQTTQTRVTTQSGGNGEASTGGLTDAEIVEAFPDAAPVAPAKGTISEPQIRMIYVLTKQLGATSKEDVGRVISSVMGFAVDSVSGLSKIKASAIISALKVKAEAQQSL